MSRPADQDPSPISADELRRVCQFLYLRTGMAFNDTRHYYVARRVADRMQRLGITNVESYLGRLATQPAEMAALVNAVTINETYFYREEDQLRALSRSILPEVVTKRPPGALVRIWSLPCSTGEEPYSIAIWLLENWPMVDAWHIEIVGSDINTTSLAAAKAGRYGTRAVARLPAGLRETYFTGNDREQYEIVDDLKESVIFSQINLMDPAGMANEPPFDVIFCRNLLIYFDATSRQIAAANLYNHLAPGGFLCLGHTESMSRIDDRFKMVRFDDTIVYRRL